MIRVGQMIRLPVDGVDGAARCDARARRGAGARAAPRPRRRSAATSAEGVYVVRRGDSIERIATRLGVDPQALIAANDIRNRNVIQVGQQLIIPNGAGRRRRRCSRGGSQPPSPAAESPVALAARVAGRRRRRARRGRRS